MERRSTFPLTRRAGGAALPTWERIPAPLRHLHRLTRSFIHDGQRNSYIHVYARPHGRSADAALEFITARESGFEGIACVDDAARAALLALQLHEMMRGGQGPGAAEALRLARAWLAFVLYMQEPDGRFVNFIADASGAKNQRGRTSCAGGAWWTARALRALAAAWRVTGEERYRRAFLRGRLAPAREHKVKALHALTLLELYQRRPDIGLQRRICAVCDAIVTGGPGYFRDRVGQREVALWGYHQLQAVARAGGLFARPDYIAACETTVRTLVEPVVAAGFYHVYPSQRDLQCAYSVSALVLGLAELYDVTGQERYRDLAQQCAAWLDGNNPARVALYDASTGCCRDGITQGAASPHCGAESAIEAGFITLACQSLTARAGTGAGVAHRLEAGS